MSQILDAINKAEDERKRRAENEKAKSVDKSQVYKRITQQYSDEAAPKSHLPLLLLVLLGAGGAFYYQQRGQHHKTSVVADDDRNAVSALSNTTLSKTDLPTPATAEKTKPQSDNGTDKSANQAVSTTPNHTIKPTLAKGAAATDNAGQSLVAPAPLKVSVVKPVVSDDAEKVAKSENKKAKDNVVQPATPLVDKEKDATKKPLTQSKNAVKNNAKNTVEKTTNSVELPPLVPLTDVTKTANTNNKNLFELTPITASTTGKNSNLLELQQPAVSKRSKPKPKKNSNKNKPNRTVKNKPSSSKTTVQNTRKRRSNNQRGWAITAIVYDDSPSARMILINGKIVREGGLIPNTKTKVIRILPKGIIVNDGNGEVLIGTR